LRTATLGASLTPLLSICDAGTGQEASKGIEPIITWKDFQKTMPWEIVILVGGGYALASGSKVTSWFSSWSIIGPKEVPKEVHHRLVRWLSR
jgi:hypothetical protein